MSTFNAPRQSGKSTYIARQAIYLMKEHYANKDSKPPVIVVPTVSQKESMEVLLYRLDPDTAEDINVETVDKLVRRPLIFEGKLILIDEAHTCLDMLAITLRGKLSEATMTIENKEVII